ncbi:AAA family ATPase [Hymenobacter monticola]|uniref:AAA family ATPase n=2 Tax=Hymenobacter TaxID=89966 RepID=A0ABY4BFW2_9BACT|nr:MULTISPECIES: AAA family ATPase [Hymenobacter]MDU0372237.1 AAA family ATPase [Hymenobacter endophyticus]UOE36631.1 AAA family ATPase [Hymenobacter monticola]
MPQRITHLKLTNFRGATQPVTVKFTPEKGGLKTNVVVIFGENGTGKSTIVDALDVVGNASFGSLLRPGIQAPQKHVASLTKDAQSVEVELTTKAGHTCKAKLSGKTVVLTAGSPDTIMPEIRVLRRRDLLQLIEATPAKRYEAIQEFIAVTGVDNAEAALRTDCNTVEKLFNNAESARAQAEKTLRALWEQEKQSGEPDSDPLAWATYRAAESTGDLQDQLDKLAKGHAAMQQVAAIVTQWQNAQTNYIKEKSTLDAAETALQDLNQGANERSSDLISLLSSAERYLALPADPSTCPLCDNGVQADELRLRIQSQLEQLQTSRSLLQKLSDAQIRLKTAADENVRCNRETVRVAKVLTTHFASYEPAAVGTLSLDWKAHEAELAVAEPSDTTSASIVALSERLMAISEAVGSEHESLQTRLTVYNNIKTQARLLNESTAEVARLNTSLERLRGACTLVVNKRREFVQTILDDIIGEVNTLYQAIHPGEKIGLHRLEMDDVKRASLEQQATFEDKSGVVPQAYFSESHLDTFGFCLWLALAKRDNPKQIVLVLDDVFTSVDAQHFRRISDLLAAQASNFQQVIVATHNRLWHDYYKISGAGVHLLKLERWTLARGLRPHEDQILIAELALALEADIFDRQAVASKAGVLLENVLDNLAAYYECSLKYRPGRGHTLGDLLRTTKKLFQEAKVQRVRRDAQGNPIAPHLEENWIKIALKRHHEKLDAIKLIRNEVGAHFNSLGNDWSDNDVREFGQAAYDLAEALACQQCGHMPKNLRADHRGCGCDAKHQTRLFPLSLN